MTKKQAIDIYNKSIKSGESVELKDLKDLYFIIISDNGEYIITGNPYKEYIHAGSYLGCINYIIIHS
ncbi:MAG: hypothetical protein II013_02175 [Lachnobacterium sp.]|nr:hypothetical protein [Lachnobacterium sp.]